MANGSAARNKNDYAGWAGQVAQSENVAFLDINEIIASEYDKLGQEKVNALFIAGAGPHTSLAGAQTNAAFGTIGSVLLRVHGKMRLVLGIILAGAVLRVALWYSWPQRPELWLGGLAAGVALVACGPPIVERNRSNWLSWWDGLKPALAVTRTGSLAVLVYPEWGYFAGHILAAGNPVHPAVRALAAEDLDALPAAGRPRYLAAMLMPGSAESSTWRTRRAAEFERWGYSIAGDSGLGAILEQTLPPIPAAADTSLDAWYAPAGTVAIAGVRSGGGAAIRIEVSSM